MCCTDSSIEYLLPERELQPSSTSKDGAEEDGSEDGAGEDDSEDKAREEDDIEDGTEEDEVDGAVFLSQANFLSSQEAASSASFAILSFSLAAVPLAIATAMM